jgi:hypothetical protein
LIDVRYFVVTPKMSSSTADGRPLFSAILPGS